MARPTTRGVASKPLAELVKNRLVANSETLDYEVLAYFCDKTPGTVESWLKSGRFGGGTALRLWHLMETAGIRSPELAKVRRETPHGEYVARLVVFGVVDLKTAREIGGNVNDEAVFAAMRGERVFFKPNLDLTQLREMYDEDLQSKIDLLKNWLENGLPDELKAQIKKGKPVPKSTLNKGVGYTTTNKTETEPVIEGTTEGRSFTTDPDPDADASVDPAASWTSTSSATSVEAELNDGVTDGGDTRVEPSPGDEVSVPVAGSDDAQVARTFDIEQIADALVDHLGLADKQELTAFIVNQRSGNQTVPVDRLLGAERREKLYQLAQNIKQIEVDLAYLLHTLTEDEHAFLKLLIGDLAFHNIKILATKLTGWRAQELLEGGKPNA